MYTATRVCVCLCVCAFYTVSSSSVTAPCPSSPPVGEHLIALSRSVASISGGAHQLSYTSNKQHQLSPLVLSWPVVTDTRCHVAFMCGPLCADLKKKKQVFRNEGI